MFINLLRNVLIPEKIKGRYILPTRVVGISLNQSRIHIALATYYGEKITIQSYKSYEIEQSSGDRHNDIVFTLAKIIPLLGSYNTVIISLCSPLIFFKELKFPFLDRQKITSVLHYEIEPLLPFAAHDAAIDFITLQKNAANKSSTVLVAAIKNDALAEYSAPFKEAQFPFNTVSIDTFNIYNLYLHAPLYRQNERIIIVSFEDTTIHIMYIEQGILKAIRSLSEGINAYAHRVEKVLQFSFTETIAYIHRFGLTKNQPHEEKVHSIFSTFCSELLFTITIFQQRFNYTRETTPVLILEAASIAVPEIETVLSQLTQQPCTLFDSTELLKNGNIVSRTTEKIPSEGLLSIAALLPRPFDEEFNLYAQSSEESKVQPLFIGQIFTLISLCVLTLALLIGNSFMQQRRLKATLSTMQRMIAESLYQNDLSEGNVPTLAIQYMKEAEEKVNKEKEIWFAFSHQSRFSFLKFLEAFTSAIDKKSTGLTINKIQITYDKILFDGEVPGFTELAILEKELQESPLFDYKTPIQTLKFTNAEVTFKKNEDQL